MGVMKVRIFQNGKHAMQSGRAKIDDWVLEYQTKSPRVPEDLMGWTSSADTLNQVRLKFSSQQDAINFAKEKGWDYTVTLAHARKVTPRNYSDNFKYQPFEE
jgi:hypothetical protein